MNLNIPVSAHDKHLLPVFTKVLQHFGGLEDTAVTFFATPSAKAEAFEAADKLRARVHVFNTDFPDGWPTAPGMQFAATVFTLPTLGIQGPWLWMELDMLPCKQGWLQALRTEYRVKGMPSMGNVVPTAWTEEGKLVVHERDTMMMGCGVYPAGMHADQRFKPLLTDLLKPGTLNPRIPFDFYLRYAIRHAGVADTTLIADMWQTHKYRQTNEGMVCEPVPMDKLRRERGGLVSPDTVIIHGCKDESLASLLLKPVVKTAATAPTTSGPAIAAAATPPVVVQTPAPEKPKPVVAAQLPMAPEVLLKMTEPITPIESPPVPEEEVFKAITEPTPEKPKPVVAPPKPEPVLVDPPPPPPVNPSSLTRTQVEEVRAANCSNTKKVAAALGLTLAEFVVQFPALGYRAVKGGKMESTF